MEYCDYSLFICPSAEALHTRLVARKLMGGLSQAEADAFYDHTDGSNVRWVLESSRSAYLMLEITSTGEYRMACP